MTTSKQLAAKHLTGVPVYVGHGFDSGVLMTAVEDAIDAGKEELRQAVVLAAQKMSMSAVGYTEKNVGYLLALDELRALPILAPPKPELSQRAKKVADTWIRFVLAGREFVADPERRDALARLIQDEYGA